MKKDSADSKKTHDWLDILQGVSGVLSGVVLVVVGLMINSSLQRSQIATAKIAADAQLEFAKVKAEDDKRLQQINLVAQLLKHLSSSNPIERELGVVALHESVPSKIYDSLMAILARGDPSKDVRYKAISKLGDSTDPNARRTLTEIQQDTKRPEEERTKAFFAMERPKRIERLLDRITKLPDAGAIALATNPPVENEEIVALLEKADPTSQRTRTATAAKRVLLMLVSYTRTYADLDKWETALTVAEKQ